MHRRIKPYIRQNEKEKTRLFTVIARGIKDRSKMREIIDFHVHPFLDKSELTCFYKQSMEFEEDFFKKDLTEAGITKSAVP